MLDSGIDRRTGGGTEGWSKTNIPPPQQLCCAASVVINVIWFVDYKTSLTCPEYSMIQCASYFRVQKQQLCYIPQFSDCSYALSKIEFQVILPWSFHVQIVMIFRTILIMNTWNLQSSTITPSVICGWIKRVFWVFIVLCILSIKFCQANLNCNPQCAPFD